MAHHTELSCYPSYCRKQLYFLKNAIFVKKMGLDKKTKKTHFILTTILFDIEKAILCPKTL